MTVLAITLGGRRPAMAVRDGPHGRLRMLDTRRGPGLAAAVARAVADHVDQAGPCGPLPRLVLAHPAGWTEREVRARALEVAPPGVPVTTCPAAVAAAVEAAAHRPAPAGPLAVLRPQPEGVEVTVLAGAGLDRAGAPPPAPSALVLATAHRPPPADPVALLRDTARAAGLAVPELTGGVLLVTAEPSPTLVERLTDLSGEPPLIADQPDRLVLSGALRAGPRPRRGQDTDPAPAIEHPAHPVPARALPAPPRRRARAVLAASALPALAAAITALVAGAATADPAADPTAPPPADRSTLLAQYGYLARLPAGWRHTGGLPERRRTQLTPAGRPEGTDLISVESTPLGYDATAEPDRALRELRERYRRDLAAGAPLTGFTLSTRIADRDVVAYRQDQPERGAQVDWYVVFDRDAQLSVGCRHTPSGAEAVRAACAEVVGSLRVQA